MTPKILEPTRGLSESGWRGSLSGVLRRQVASGEEGATMVEMAIASVVLLMMLFGVIVLSLSFYTYNYVSDAAREASRWAIVRGSQCSANTPGLDHCGAGQTEIQNYVSSLSYPGIDPSKLTVTANWYSPNYGNGATTWTLCDSKANPCTTPNGQGYQVQVTVGYRFPLSIPFWKATTLNVSSTSSMVISQ